MGLLKIDNHSKGYRLLGVSVPQWLHNYLSLYSLAKKKTKSDIVKGWADAWYSQISSKEPPEKLVYELVEFANAEWELAQKKFPEKTIDEFKDELKKEMVKRGLNIPQMNVILKGIR
jgi:hypothetical protein